MDLYFFLSVWTSLFILTSAQYQQNQNYPNKPLPKLIYPTYVPSSSSDPEFNNKFSPSTPRPIILSHRQSLTHDGGFKYAFATDNGLQQGETITPDGARQGQYSYIDTNGQTITVRYSAGKEGFRILDGPNSDNNRQQSPPPQQYQNRESPPPPPPFYNTPIIQKPAIIDNNINKYNSNYQSKFPFISQNYNPQNSLQSNQGGPSKYVAYRSPDVGNYKSGTQGELKEEPEYNDEPGKPHSFGNGYYFEFSG